MSHPAQFPGQLSELEFVSAYARSALRKPQLAADAALQMLVFAEAGDRAVLVGLIAQELAEACRRLAGVHAALADRRYSIARSLMQPLPGVEQFRNLAHQAATFTPEQMLRELSLGEEALPHAQHLRGHPDLAGLTDLVAAAETGNVMLLVPGNGNIPRESWVAGVSTAGDSIAASFGADEHDGAQLADITADLAGIARGFLNAYLDGRYHAGRRD